MDDKKLDEEVVAGTPKPAGSPVAGLWMDKPEYPLTHADHGRDLEIDAAINEYGHRMPKSKAESRAYEKYKRGQHVSAAAHHLAGMKAAQGAGDMEAARKHGLMYNLHSKALGHEPVGPAHPEVVAEMGKKPAKVYRFKPHRGDMLALHDREKPQEAGIEKSEVLHRLWKTVSPLIKGDVVGKIGNEKGAEAQPKHKKKFHDIGIAGAKRWAKQNGVPEHENAPKYGSYFEKGDVVKFPGNPKPVVDKGKEADVESIKQASLDRGRPFPLKTKKSELNEWAKSELAARKKSKVIPCVCESYQFPHRHGSGKCGGKK